MTYLFVTQEDTEGSVNYNGMLKRCHKIVSYLNANDVLVREYVILARRNKTKQETIDMLRTNLGSSVSVMYLNSEASFYQVIFNNTDNKIFVIPDNRSSWVESLLNFNKELDDNIFLYKIHNLYQIEKEDS